MHASPLVIPSQRLTGRHVLVVVVLFFGIVFAVNGVLLWKALSTHSGVVAQEPYRKGLAYNTRIAADARQAALGWSALLDVEAKGLVALTLVDATGRPVSELDLRVSKRDHVAPFLRSRAGCHES